jgi:hypothetical protein
MGLCYDIEGNTVDCGSSDTVGYSAGVSSNDIGAGLNLSSTDNPVASQAGQAAGPGWLQTLITTSGNVVSKAISSPAPTAGLRLQINPATGQQQYFNPTTGQYIGGAVNTSGFSGLFSGSNSFILIIVALAIAFFAFGGRKRLAA